VHPSLDPAQKSQEAVLAIREDHPLRVRNLRVQVPWYLLAKLGDYLLMVSHHQIVEVKANQIALVLFDYSLYLHPQQVL
jgi:hypothetical protein